MISATRRATENDALLVLEDIIQQWNHEHPPFKTDGSWFWNRYHYDVARNIINSKIRERIKDDLHNSDISKDHLRSYVVDAFTAVLRDFKNRRHADSPSPELAPLPVVPEDSRNWQHPLQGTKAPPNSPESPETPETPE